jgi:hypothetical protein
MSKRVFLENVVYSKLRKVAAMTLGEKEAILRRYADGKIGTRVTIEAIGGRDYADLVIALAQAEIDFPKPAPTPSHEANFARARTILQPRLKHGH